MNFSIEEESIDSYSNTGIWCHLNLNFERWQIFYLSVTLTSYSQLFDVMGTHIK